MSVDSSTDDKSLVEWVRRSRNGNHHRFRQDLLAAGFGNGCHAFEIALPAGAVAIGALVTS